MFIFANIKLLYLLAVIPLLVVLYVFIQIKQKRRLREFGNIDTILGLMPNVSKSRPHIKFGIMMLVVGLLIVAMARPKVLQSKGKVTKQGVEAMLVLDISNSMLAQDIAPNRLSYAKMLLSQMIDKMNNDKVGLIVFAGDAFIQMPITSDNVSAKMFLKNIQPSLINVQGTAIGTAIELAVRSFGSSNQKAGKAIFIITDAENHEDNAVEAANMAKDNGVIVNVIGIGSNEGVPIPMSGTMSYIKDKDGNVVVTKLNEELAREVAVAGGGIYVRATNTRGTINAIEKTIDKMQKGDFESAASDYDERFYVPIFLAIILLLVEYFLFRRKNKLLNKINIFGKENL